MSMPKPVMRQVMASEWSPKILRAWALTVRQDTWNTPGRNSPPILYMGDHQQQALGGRIGGGQGTGLQGAVAGAGGTRFRLHLNDLHRISEDVLFSLGRPLIHLFRHGGRGGDGEDGRHLGEGIGRIRRGGVAVHHNEFFLAHM